TVREQDGLAMSSRNAYLSPAEREHALSLWNALSAAREAVFAGQTDPSTIVAAASAQLSGVELEYLELVDPDTLVAVERVDGPTLAAIAAKCGTTRLIDNLLLQPVRAASAEPDSDFTTQSISSGTNPSKPIYQGAVA
ncbi:MAG: 4-phosphopantoate--beta-alanine ligase, partial [Thermoleophilaceae bacterium]|nr:4-phosphopantoate--beta-alanine ligase [Thermoleophilaceae bacterium]